jgi:hypothetical protein
MEVDDICVVAGGADAGFLVIAERGARVLVGKPGRRFAPVAAAPRRSGL